MLIRINKKSYDTFREADNVLLGKESLEVVKVSIYLDAVHIKSYLLSTRFDIKSQIYKINNKDNVDKLILLLNDEGDNNLGFIYNHESSPIYSPTAIKNFEYVSREIVDIKEQIKSI